MAKNNNQENKLIGSDLVFTRYLYVKDEVCISLLVSILNKSDDAIFWAYELFYSGFKTELLKLIWKIYYDFFATLNPTFEQYLLKKHKELLVENKEDNNEDNNEDKDKDKLISSLIQDLLFRPFNTDVFLLRNAVENFEMDIIYHHNAEIITDTTETSINMTQWIKNSDYRSISQWIFNVNNSINIVDIYNICLDIFLENGLKLTKSKLAKEFVSILKSNTNHKIILLAKIMCLFSKKAELKKGKSIYINVEPEDIIPYETICGSKELKHYKILEKATICGIDELKHLSLFKLKRSNYNLQEKYWYNWEYHASFSPLWSQRITKFGGYIDYTKQKVVFKEEPDDELMQQFYGLYGLEPDEQLLSVQQKNIQKIEKKYDWKWFNNKYKRNGLFEIYEEELEEFDESGLIY
jgi:hypothetical protein